MKKIKATLLLTMFTTVSAFAQEAEAVINTGDTAWLLIATALVMLMTPAGLALFYGGLTQNKHVLNTIGMSYMAFCTGTIVWVIIGYSLAFGEGSGFIGGFEHLLLSGIGVNDVSGTIPTLLFVVFQGTFRQLLLPLFRAQLSSEFAFRPGESLPYFGLLRYMHLSRIGFWGGGLLSESGEMDFAGGTVIHIMRG